MNLRYYRNQSTLIAKLADQAHEEMTVRYEERMKTEYPGDVIFYDMFNQRFAELIVKECADIALREDHDTYECIKSHFGVK